MHQIEQKVYDAIAQTVESLGYEIVAVEYAKKYSKPNITVFIYIESGVSLDDCEKVHLAIDPIIDELNPLGEQAYVLNVSSPGLDRPFITHRDFERNYGKEVEVKLYAPLRGKKLLEGVLLQHSEHTMLLSVDGAQLKLENSKVAKVCPLVKFE